jgi:anti-anti-sigma factor
MTDIFKIEVNGHILDSKNSQLEIQPSNLNLDLEERGDVFMFHLSGALTLPGDIKKFVEVAMSAMVRKNKFLLDMTNLEFLNSTLIGEITRFSGLLKTSGGVVCISCANKFIKDFLRMANVGRIIPIFENLSSAFEWLDGVKSNPDGQ